MVSAGHGFDLHGGPRAVQGEAFAVTAGGTGSATCLSGEGGVLLNSLQHAGKPPTTKMDLLLNSKSGNWEATPCYSAFDFHSLLHCQQRFLNLDCFVLKNRRLIVSNKKRKKCQK